MKSKFTKFFTLALVLTAMAAIVASCGKKQEKEQTEDEYVFTATSVDSMQIQQLVDQYMNYVVAGEYEKAVDMLVEPDNEELYDEPYPLPEERRAEVLKNLRRWPVVKYEIAELNFYRSYENQVRVRVYLNDEISTGWSFKPIKYVDKWSLALTSTADGDESLSKKAPNAVVK